MLEQVAKSLQDLAEAGLSQYDHKHVDRIYFRAKSVSSFVGKVHKRAEDAAAGVEREGQRLVAYSNPLSQIEDQVGGRVLVFFRHDIADVVKLLTPGTFNTMEMQDKTPLKDSEFGYESTHLICHIPYELRPAEWDQEAPMPETFELQVRTLFMHAWAEPQHNLGYKAPTDLSRDERRQLAWIAAAAWGADDSLDRAWHEIGEPVE
jgi:ppGpp synthetase/RelA/SpoT-type nucleotidyltranferase